MNGCSGAPTQWSSGRGVDVVYIVRAASPADCRRASTLPRRAPAAVGQMGGGDPRPREGCAGVAGHLRHGPGRRPRLRRRCAPLQGCQGQAQLPQGRCCSCTRRHTTPPHHRTVGTCTARAGTRRGIAVDAAAAAAAAATHGGRPSAEQHPGGSSGGVPGPPSVRAHTAERRRGPAGCCGWQVNARAVVVLDAGAPLGVASASASASAGGSVTRRGKCRP
jgi:hypothetical protein